MAVPPVVSLPKIQYEFDCFQPSQGWNNERYSIGKPAEARECVLMRHKETDQGTQPIGSPVTVDPSTKHPIQAELQTISRMINCYLYAGLGIGASAIVGLYFSFAKRNFKVGGVSAACACALAFLTQYFEMQRKRAAFDAANKVISTFEKSDELLYKRSDYGL